MHQDRETWRGSPGLLLPLRHLLLSLSFPLSVLKVPARKRLIPASGPVSDSSTDTWAVERWACGSQQPSKSQPLELWGKRWAASLLGTHVATFQRPLQV